MSTAQSAELADALYDLRKLIERDAQTLQVLTFPNTFQFCGKCAKPLPVGWKHEYCDDCDAFK